MRAAHRDIVERERFSARVDAGNGGRPRHSRRVGGTARARHRSRPTHRRGPGAIPARPAGSAVGYWSPASCSPAAGCCGRTPSRDGRRHDSRRACSRRSRCWLPVRRRGFAGARQSTVRSTPAAPSQRLGCARRRVHARRVRCVPHIGHGGVVGGCGGRAVGARSGSARCSPSRRHAGARRGSGCGMVESGPAARRPRRGPSSARAPLGDIGCRARPRCRRPGRPIAPRCGIGGRCAGAAGFGADRGPARVCAICPPSCASASSRSSRAWQATCCGRVWHDVPRTVR